MPTKRTLIAVALLSLSPVALAHGPSRGPNGGQMQDIGSYHGELLAQDGRLTFFLFDTNDRPLPANGVTATAIVLASGRQQTLTFALRPDGKALFNSFPLLGSRVSKRATRLSKRPDERHGGTSSARP
jgi:hypothetical protein